MRNMRFIGAAVVGVAALLSASGTALAQPGGGGRGGMGGGMPAWMPEAVSARNFDSYLKTLGVADDQAVAAKSLFDGYAAQARAAQEKFRTKFDQIRQKAQDTGDWSVMGDLRTPGKELRESRKKMDEQLVADLKQLLTADQSTQWPKVERAMRRDQSMGRGQIAGERVDLVALAGKMDMDAATRKNVRATLDLYEDELDAELIKRSQMIDAQAEKMANATGFDPAAMQEAMVKGRDAGLRLRDLNRKYARQIADSLPDADRVAFNDAVKHESYPDIFRPTQSAKAFEAAVGFKDLDSEQKEKLLTLRAAYERDANAANEKLIVAIDEMQKNFDPTRMFGGQGRGPGGGQGGGGRGGAMGDLRRARRDFDTKTLDELKKVLRPEQVERLPKPDAADQNGPGGPGRRFRGDQT